MDGSTAAVWWEGKRGDEFASFIVMEFQEIKLMNNKKFWWQRWKRTNEWRLSGLRCVCGFSCFALLSLFTPLDDVDDIANGNYFIVIRRHRRHVIKFSVNLAAHQMFDVFTHTLLHSIYTISSALEHGQRSISDLLISKSWSDCA